MEIEVSKREGAVVVALDGWLDSVTSGELDQEMVRLIGDGEKYFVLDFEKVEYISSAGLRTILSANKKLKGSGGRLSVASLRHAVREVFEISGSTNIVRVFESVESALGRNDE